MGSISSAVFSSLNLMYGVKGYWARGYHRDLVQGWKPFGKSLEFLLVTSQSCFDLGLLGRITQIEHQVGEGIDLLFELLA